MKTKLNKEKAQVTITLSTVEYGCMRRALLDGALYLNTIMIPDCVKKGETNLVDLFEKDVDEYHTIFNLLPIEYEWNEYKGGKK